MKDSLRATWEHSIFNRKKRIQAILLSPLASMPAFLLYLLLTEGYMSAFNPVLILFASFFIFPISYFGLIFLLLPFLKLLQWLKLLNFPIALVGTSILGAVLNFLMATGIFGSNDWSGFYMYPITGAICAVAVFITCWHIGEMGRQIYTMTNDRYQ